MAANDKPKFDIPWGTLLPLVAVVAGIIVQYKPLVSERPLAPAEKSVGVVAEQDVDARLWQDPLAVARKGKEADEAAKWGTAARPDAERHSINSLANKI